MIYCLGCKIKIALVQEDFILFFQFGFRSKTLNRLAQLGKPRGLRESNGGETEILDISWSWCSFRFCFYSIPSQASSKASHFITSPLKSWKKKRLSYNFESFVLIDLLRLCYSRSIIKECSKSVGEMNAG